MTQNEFIIKAKLKHGDKYDYSLVVYKGSLKKVKIICPIHGKFLQSASDHKNGKGCNECTKFNIASFITKSRKKHFNKYDYSLVNATKAKDKVRIICPIHGEFLQVASNHQEGKGCKGCATFGFNTQKPATLYYLSVNDGEAYKIGITNKALNKRFSLTEMEKIKVLKTFDFEVGINAYLEEQRILKEFQYAKYDGVPLLISGNTELFDRDVLLLDTH